MGSREPQKGLESSLWQWCEVPGGEAETQGRAAGWLLPEPRPELKVEEEGGHTWPQSRRTVPSGDWSQLGEKEQELVLNLV